MDTYVVRVWRPAPNTPEQGDRLFGLVYDVTGQSQVPFSSLAELGAVLMRTAQPEEAPGNDGLAGRLELGTLEAETGT